MMKTQHPRYVGPVVDMHVHYDPDSRAMARSAIRTGELEAAVSLWDTTWPPTAYGSDLEDWRACEPHLFRCFVPDLSHVGEPGWDTRLIEELTWAASNGCVGMKVWKNIGLWLTDDAGRRLQLDDERLDVLWQAAADFQLPVVIHVGDPPAFWEPIVPENPRYGDLSSNPDWWYGGGDFPRLEELHDAFAAVLARHRATTFVGAHFGCFVSDPGSWLRDHSNLHLDTAAAIAEIGRDTVVEQTRGVFQEYPDRVMFGTDLSRTAGFEYPNFGRDRWKLETYFERHWRFFETADVGLSHPIPEQLPWSVVGLDLPSETLSQLYCGNALQRFPRLAAALGRIDVAFT
jgi:hypothetical protein